MSFATIAGLLLDGYPTERLGPNVLGYSRKYRGDYATLATNKPAQGEDWGGVPVTGVEFYRMGRSDLGELIVETEQTTGDGVTVSSTLESTRYQIRWQPVDVPLFEHPAFIPGGASALSATASGSPSRTHMADVFGWENEQDVVLKSAYKYKRVLSDGSVGAELTLTGGALAYAKLRMLGFETYPAYLPTWSKVGTYSGTATPGVGTIGQYTASPDGSGFPTGYQWVKITDDADRIGRRARWERTEAWQGYVKVWLDIDTLNPASNTLP